MKITILSKTEIKIAIAVENFDIINIQKLLKLKPLETHDIEITSGNINHYYIYGEKYLVQHTRENILIATPTFYYSELEWNSGIATNFDIPKDSVVFSEKKQILLPKLTDDNLNMQIKKQKYNQLQNLLSFFSSKRVTTFYKIPIENSKIIIGRTVADYDVKQRLNPNFPYR